MKKIIFIIMAFVLAVNLAVIIFFTAAALYCRWWNPPGTMLREARAIMYNDTLRPMTFIPLSRLPKNTVSMVLFLEDQRFYDHQGIDFKAIEEAMDRNEKAGYYRYGASTVTQQTVRTLFLIPYKSMIRKYVEAVGALVFDFIIPKKRILELYLNYAEWGRGIYGIQAASGYYYHTRLTNLTQDQIARLLVILASPRRYSIDNFTKNPILNARYKLLTQHIEQ